MVIWILVSQSLKPGGDCSTGALCGQSFKLFFNRHRDSAVPEFQGLGQLGVLTEGRLDPAATQVELQGYLILQQRLDAGFALSISICASVLASKSFCEANLTKSSYSLSVRRNSPAGAMLS